MPLTAPADLSEAIAELLERAHAASVFPGAACRVAIGGETVVDLTVGSKATVDDNGRPIPVAEREPVERGTVFDLASVTKVFSAHTLLTLVDRADLHLDEPIGAILPAYRSSTKAGITLRHLLTHTSGLPAEWRGWHAPLIRAAAARTDDDAPFRAWPLADRDALIADLLATEPTAEPGSRWEYSDAGLNTAMLLAEQATGERWASLVARHTLEPLGLNGATFTPERTAAAATEYQPQFGRGVVRAVVHDEASWSLGGSCANAGMFATSAALLRFAEAIRIGDGWVRGEAMWADQLARLLGPADARPEPSFGAALGLRIGETAWMGEAGRASRGHTGFTGTSVQIDRDAAATIVLVTNRVHPSRDGASVHPLRAAIAEAVLRAA